MKPDAPNREMATCDQQALNSGGAGSGFAPVTGSAMDPANFVRFARLAEAGLEGHEYALDARLPRIPGRWDQSELRDSWITGYLTELRNRLESQNSD